MDITPAVVAERLTKNFNINLGFKSFPAIKEISFTLEHGEILGFLGPNGAGKTTTIKCLLGLLRPSSGSIKLWGYPPADPSIRRKIGYVPENPDYEDIFTPLEFLRLVARMRSLRNTTKDDMMLLERVGLSNWEKTRMRNYSKGMRQRFSLALALQSKPDLLVLDEPTGGLDPLARKEFRDIILEENKRGATIFLSSHLLSEVETICTRVLILDKGQVVREESMEALLTSEDYYRIDYQGEICDEAAQICNHSFTDNEGYRVLHLHSDSLQNVIDILRKENHRILRIEPVFRRLEDVFLSATGSRKE